MKLNHSPYIKPANKRGFWVVVNSRNVEAAKSKGPRVFKTRAQAQAFIQDFLLQNQL